MYGDWSGAFRLFGFLLFIGVPLAIWKLIDIAIWLVTHVHIGIKP